jgi:tight adherence protein B
MLGSRRARLVAAALAVAAMAIDVGPVPGLVAAVVAFALARRAKASAARRALRATRVADLHALRALAAELGSGLAPVTALSTAAGTGDGLGRRMSAAARAEERGGDPADVLRAGAGAGTPAAALAAAWSVCQRTGSSLKEPVQRIADGAAGELRIDREAEAALAPARASARLLAVLPFAGVVLGQVSGAGSMHALLTTGIGQACLLLGALLDLAGLAWLDRLADSASA